LAKPIEVKHDDTNRKDESIFKIEAKESEMEGTVYIRQFL